MEMGGASMQVAFELDKDKGEDKINRTFMPPGQVTSVLLGKKSYTLYLASWLGYGQNQALKR